MSDVRGYITQSEWTLALKEVALALGYDDAYSDDGYNEACIHSPREVLDRIYALGSME